MLFSYTIGSGTERYPYRTLRVEATDGPHALRRIQSRHGKRARIHELIEAEDQHAASAPQTTAGSTR